MTDENKYTPEPTMNLDDSEYESPSVIGGPPPPMPTWEQFRTAHKAEYVRLLVDLGVPEGVAASWHDEGWDERLHDLTPQDAVAEETSYWEGE